MPELWVGLLAGLGICILILAGDWLLSGTSTIPELCEPPDAKVNCKPRARVSSVHKVGSLQKDDLQVAKYRKLRLSARISWWLQTEV